MDEVPQFGEKELPRWVQISAGWVLGSVALLCGFASLVLMLAPHMPIPILGFFLGLVLLLGSFWVLEKSFRLLTGRKYRGGLLGPKTLQVLAFFFLLLPVAGLFTGYYSEKGPLAIIQAAMYFVIFLGLRALAKKRQEKNGLDERTKG
jgi:hypothetical protein